MEAYSLFEVNQHIKQVLALNFQEPIWVECEIAQANETRGQVYLELIEKREDSDEILARCSAVIWFKQYLFIKKKLGDLLDTIIQDGVKVKIKVNIEFHEKFGLKLVIEDVDPSYSLGLFELARQKIIERLKKEELLDLNSQLQLPLAIQKIAVISSHQAAGFKDFSKQISNNIYGYDFKLELFASAMQGANTEREITAAIREISKSKEAYDVIVITRGGGSKIDLSSFDNYNIAHAISQSKIPVLTGIGHEIDQTVTDIVAHSILKTPTAVANFIIDHNMNTESEFIALENSLVHIAETTISDIKFTLQEITQNLVNKPFQIIKDKSIELALLKNEMENMIKNVLHHKAAQLETVEEKLELLKPENILKKGFCLIAQGEKYIGKTTDLNGKKAFEINFSDGQIEAKQV